MKVKCRVEKIKTAVQHAEKITGKNLTLPVLGAILFSAKRDKLVLRATNLSLGTEITIPAQVEKEGGVAVSGSILTGVFSNVLDNEEILLTEENGNLSIKTKTSSVLVKGQAFDDFPTIPLVDGKRFEIESGKLLEGIKSVYYSASPSDVKPDISSVYFRSEDGDVVFAATDSFRLAEKKIKTKGIGEIEGILLPFKNVPEVLRIFGDTPGNILVSFSKNQISFSSDEVYLTSRVVDGVFPDYRQIIPKEFSTEAVVLKQDILSALKLSNVFSDKFNRINLSIRPKEGVFELSSASGEVGENRTRLSAALEGGDVALSFNYKYFLDCLPAVSSDSVRIRLNDASKPMVISGVSDSSFTYLIMPMNK